MRPLHTFTIEFDSHSKIAVKKLKCLLKFPKNDIDKRLTHKNRLPRVLKIFTCWRKAPIFLSFTPYFWATTTKFTVRTRKLTQYSYFLWKQTSHLTSLIGPYFIFWHSSNPNPRNWNSMTPALKFFLVSLPYKKQKH